MLQRMIPRGRGALLALSLAMCTTACAGGANPDRPAKHRLTPLPQTEIPRGSVACSTSSTGWCLSDAENGQLLTDYEKGERARDRKLCWLLAYFGYEPCEAE